MNGQRGHGHLSLRNSKKTNHFSTAKLRGNDNVIGPGDLCSHIQGGGRAVVRSAVISQVIPHPSREAASSNQVGVTMARGAMKRHHHGTGRSQRNPVLGGGMKQIVLS